MQVGCHKETDNVHLVVYQVNQLSLGLQKMLINHKMNAVCFLVTTYLQSVVHCLIVASRVGPLHYIVMLQYVVLHCVMSQYVVLHCVTSRVTLYYITLHCFMSHYCCVALSCHIIVVLHCVMSRYIVLIMSQYVVLHCVMLCCIVLRNMLHCVMSHYAMLHWKRGYPG